MKIAVVSPALVFASARNSGLFCGGNNLHRIILFLLISLFLAIGAIGANAQNVKEIRIGIDGTNPPFSHANIDGELSGLDIDLANSICKQMKVNCNFVRLNWDNIIPALRGDKIDLAIGAITINDQRLKLVDFSDPYLILPSVLITSTNSTLSGVSEDDLQFTKIGAMKSSIHAEFLRTHFPNVEIVVYDSAHQFFLDLANQRLDAVIGNSIQLHRWLATDEGVNCCRALGQLPVDTKINGRGFAIAVKKGRDELLARTNNALAALTKSQKLAKTIRVHLPFLK